MSPPPKAAPTLTLPISTSGACSRTARMGPTNCRICCWTSWRRCTCCSPAAISSSPARRPDALLKHALRVVRQGYGFPSIFNADTVVQEQLRQGKTLEDARAGGCSGCVEVGRFWQGGLHPHGLLQPGEGARTDAAQRAGTRGPASCLGSGPADPAASAPSRNFSPLFASSCAISSRSRSRAAV